jgi:hypothetical protein
MVIIRSLGWDLVLSKPLQPGELHEDWSKHPDGAPLKLNKPCQVEGLPHHNPFLWKWQAPGKLIA